MLCTMKTCTKCGESKSEDEFHFRSHKKDGSATRHAHCKVCRCGIQNLNKQKKTALCECGRTKYIDSKTCRECRYALNRLGGPNSPSWRGGTTKTSRGYITQRVQNHPYSDANGSVFQHRLVMESVLGRYLLPGETVHHKNGVRDDNRPENLELWVSYQPSGQRPEDLLEWADEIIRRYRMPV